MENQLESNNIERENINQKNINSNENKNNINVNNNNDYLIKVKQFFNKFPSITISFLIFLIITITLYLYSKIEEIDSSKYVFQFAPIVQKCQYYRIITRYFIHFGVCHLSLELFALFHLCKICENLFGTLLTLSIILTSMILVSIIQLLKAPISSFLLGRMLSHYFNYFYEGGLTPVLFALLTYYSLYKKNRNEELFFIESYLTLRRRYRFMFFLFVLLCFTPNRSFSGNVSGILGGIILKKYPKYFLPKVKWIKDVEDKYSLNKINILYKYINLNNNRMKDILTEYDRDSVEEMNESKKIGENNDKNNIEFEEINENIENENNAENNV